MSPVERERLLAGLADAEAELEEAVAGTRSVRGRAAVHGRRSRGARRTGRDMVLDRARRSQLQRRITTLRLRLGRGEGQVSP